MKLPDKHRTYCKSCQDFTIHKWKEKELTCENCNTIENGYNISEVDPKLIEIQRQRYKSQKQINLKDILGVYMLSSSMIDFEPSPQKIIECDAGQKEIDERKKQLKELERQKEQLRHQDYLDNYKNLNRNDKCSCGSNKKYKQCCLPKFINY